ncbi:hypothetical protein HRJ40_11655 [Lactobacillus plantarum]|uniref:hypothetical protein n=1 Tax=Lactiplantibacillus plantarum TaxID=1590 RepID=UPI00156E5080|nr:hypothetical protein [Lactiplantibacillus plantarum]NSL96145.1 hypothetical protein [Lactiplantibacillus plantarum]
MADITHGTWIKDGKAIDSVYQSGVKVYGRNLLVGINKDVHQAPGWYQWVTNIPTKFIKVGQSFCFSAFINNAPYAEANGQGKAFCIIQAKDSSGKLLLEKDGNVINFDADGVSQANLIIPDKTDSILLFVETNGMHENTYYGYPKAELGTTATPWTPAPEDILN